MEIYIVRHGDALEGEPDELRELSEKGKKQAKKVGKILKNLDAEISEIFSSPLKRAIQTAEIITEGINFNGEIKITELLYPSSNPDEILNELMVMKKDKILLVGHQPFLGNF
ncbi:MAG: phosphohistidine phosphatase SixA, partial [Euryarchaeota archaeon HGW-Euryarchaeota-1]